MAACREPRSLMQPPGDQEGSTVPLITSTHHTDSWLVGA